jgi:drug/metabolite transporter (DMT)-like permease
MAIAIACGLGTALCFGTGDFLARQLTHRHGWFAAMVGVQLAAGIVLLTLALAWHGSPPAEPDAWLTIAGLGLANTLGLVGLYRAFETGELSLVSPIAGSMGAFALGFAWLLGSPPAPLLIPGLLAVVLGIAAASVAREQDDAATTPMLGRALGVGWALLSAIAFGWVFLRLGPASERVGPAWAVAGVRVVAIASLLSVGLLRRADEVEGGAEPRRWLGRFAVVALLDSGGMVLFAFGSSQGLGDADLAVVAVLASIFPLVTIVLARWRLHERLAWWQWVGIGAVVAGIAWISGQPG